LLWTIVVMSWTSLFPEMIPDEKDRATVSGWREVFSLIGLLVGVALPPIIVGADWSGRGTMALWFGVITPASFAVSLLGSRENPAFQRMRQPAFIPALKATFDSASFRWFLVANLHKEFIFSIMTASIPFWAKYVLLIQSPATAFGAELGVDLQNSLLLGSAFVMALPGIPVWTWAAKRWGGVGLSLAGLLVLPDLLISSRKPLPRPARLRRLRHPLHDRLRSHYRVGHRHLGVAPLPIARRTAEDDT